jgi:Protein of unknown function (DUF2917)
MKLHPMNLAVVLAQGALQSIEDGCGSSVQCLEGALWLTQQGDTRDIVLEAGESFVLDRPGTAALQALGGPARLSIGAAPAAARQGRAPSRERPCAPAFAR